MTDRELVGYADVDAGLIWVGDPCYVLGSDASHGVKEWDDFCGALQRAGAWTGPQLVTQPLGTGVGFAVPTAWGDGSYPVYVTRDGRGRVIKVEVVFDGGEDDE